MKLKATYRKHISNFINPGGTSRGVLMQKDSYIVEIYDITSPLIVGFGEVSVIENLSIDAISNLEGVVAFVCDNIDFVVGSNLDFLDRFPAVKFGVESALLDLKNGGKQIYYPSDFTLEKDFISINGLVWMGDIDFMLRQIEDKLAHGYSCLKLKIGANDFNSELELLSQIRESY